MSTSDVTPGSPGTLPGLPFLQPDDPTMIQDPHLFRYLETYCKQKMHLVPVAGHDWQGDWDLGKQPLISIYEASHDMAVIEAWAKRWPGCNWGWVPQQGRANLDVDPRHGGDVVLAKLEAEYGPLPLVPRVRTGGGGWHDTFAVPADLTFDVDIEGNEGLTFSSGKRQFLLPPSIHRNGTPYACERKFTTTPTHPATDWLLAFVSEKATAGRNNDRTLRSRAETRPMRFKAAAGSLAEDPGVAEGCRRKTLVRLLGIELARGRTAEEIEPDALAWGERCTPPLQVNEVLRCLDSLAKRHEARSLLAISGTTHHHPQEMERLPPGKEGINSATVQAVGQETYRPDLIPSFQAEAEAGITGELILQR